MKQNNKTVKMLTMTTTTVGIFMYKCGLCPACVGKRLIIWRQQAVTRLAHTKRSHMAIVLLVMVLFSVYFWTMYPQIFYFIRYHAWRTNHRTITREYTKTLRRNITYADVCSKDCLPDVDSMMASGYDVPYTTVTEVSLTLMTTDKSSEDVLKAFLNHYSKMRRVQRIILHWTKSVPPPDYEKDLDLGVPLVVTRLNSTSLSARFRSIKDIKTEGVMIIDDDIMLNRDQLYNAFALWQAHPWGIVGFYGGTHTDHGNQGYKHSMVPFNFYSMIHQGAFIIHKEYMRLYNDKFTTGVAKVDCDDMALNFLVSNHCHCAAAYYIIPKSLYIRVTDKFEILSTKWQYKTENNVCLNYYIAFFRGMPLKSKTCFW